MRQPDNYLGALSVNALQFYSTLQFLNRLLNDIHAQAGTLRSLCRPEEHVEYLWQVFFLNADTIIPEGDFRVRLLNVDLYFKEARLFRIVVLVSV